MALSVGEIVTKIMDESSKKTKQELLKRHDSLALKQLIKLNYDKTCNISVNLKEMFKISPKPQHFGDVTLYSESKRMYVFFEQYQKTGAKGWTEIRRQAAFAALIESLDPVEANYLLLACNRKLKLGLTAKDIDAVFPDLIEKAVKESAE